MIDDRSDAPDIVRAALFGNSTLVAELLENGADVNAVEPRNNLTALHVACLQNDVAIAKIIIAHDEKFGDVNFDLRSLHSPRLAWQLAASSNFLELAELVHEASLAHKRRDTVGISTIPTGNGPS